MALTLTPEQERRVTAYAKQKQKPVERVIEEWIQELPEVKTDTPETDATLTTSTETWQETFTRWKVRFDGRDLPDPPAEAFSREAFYEQNEGVHQ